MIGLTPEKLVIIAVIVGLLIGPERLPAAAAALGKFVRNVRGLAFRARDQVKENMGEEFDEVDWSKLDPTRYDPRRIIRDALREDSGP